MSVFDASSCLCTLLTCRASNFFCHSQGLQPPNPRLSLRSASPAEGLSMFIAANCSCTSLRRWFPVVPVAECAKKPHYASKQLGDRLHLPHGRGARRVAMVERPCPRDGGESRGWLREETPTTEDEETEIVTVLTHTLQSETPTREKRENRGYFEKSRGGGHKLCCRKLHSKQPSSGPAPQKNFFLFFSCTLREGGACPGLESRGGVRASNMQCKPKYPKPACLLCLRIASLPEQSAGRLLGGGK